MRRRNLRAFAFITIVVALSVLILSFQKIDLPGESFDREATGPLGLSLGLDLSGGTHLVYSAEAPVIVDISFESITAVNDIKLHLIANGYLNVAVDDYGEGRVSIRMTELSPQGEQQLRSILEEIDVIEDFSVRRENPTSEQMEGVVDVIERRINAFGVSEPLIQTFGEDRVLVQIPGAENVNIDAIFREQVQEAAVVDFLDQLGFGDAEILVIGPKALSISDTYTIGESELTSGKVVQLRSHLQESIGTVASFESDYETGEIEAVFEDQIYVSDLVDAIREFGLNDPYVLGPIGTEIRMRVEPSVIDVREALRVQLKEAFGPIDSYEISGGVEEAKSLIGQTASLKFMERSCLNDTCSEFVDKDTVGDKGEQLTGGNLEQAFADTHPTTAAPIVRFVFDGPGTRIFRELTSRIEGDSTKCVATFLDDVELICPVVNQRIISGDGFVEGPDFTYDSVRTLAIQLEAGSLPVALELIRESTVGAVLGDASLRASLRAGIVGLILVALFMLAYYRMSGLVAALSLTVYAVIVLAAFKMFPVTLTLSGLAALVISIGMAVDANILIFERIKEELRMGRSLRSAIEIGFRRAWNAIRDSNVSTFITCGILFYFGRELAEPRIIGFSLTLFVGVAVSMFTAITVSKNLLQFLAITPLKNKPNLFTPERLAGPSDGVESERQ